MQQKSIHLDGCNNDVNYSVNYPSTDIANIILSELVKRNDKFIKFLKFIIFISVILNVFLLTFIYYEVYYYF